MHVKENQHFSICLVAFSTEYTDTGIYKSSGQEIERRILDKEVAGSNRVMIDIFPIYSVLYW